MKKLCLMLLSGWWLTGWVGLLSPAWAAASSAAYAPSFSMAMPHPPAEPHADDDLSPLEWLTAALGGGALIGYGLALLGLTGLALPALLLGLAGMGLAAWLRRRRGKQSWAIWLGRVGGGLVFLAFLLAAGLVLLF